MVKASLKRRSNFTRECGGLDAWMTFMGELVLLRLPDEMGKE